MGKIRKIGHLAATWWLLSASLCMAVLLDVRLNGDGGEYLVTAHAIVREGGVAITPDLLDNYLRLPEAEHARVGFPVTLYRDFQEVFKTPQPQSYGGYASVQPGHMYSMHFWLYPLLAAPLYALASLAGWNTVWSLALLNLALCAGACAGLRRAMPGHWRMAVPLFLATGTLFYLRWSGPEVMSAACALLATIALLRGQAGWSIFLAGAGATQNPSLVFIMPFALAARALQWRFPALAWPGVAPAALSRGALALAGAGLAIAAAPYIWFQAIFGVPSLTGNYFTQSSLISWQRFTSLFLDLDQGMVAGVPGLFAGLLAAFVMIDRRERARFALAALCCAALMVAMAVPPLAALNWNSGAVVMMRYAYWLAMPLLALLLFAMATLSQRRAAAIAAIVLACQLPLMLEYGVFGERYAYLNHTRPAAWMLNHAPALYHPDPEVFFERGTHAEAPGQFPVTLAHLHLVRGEPRKLLRHASNLASSLGRCGPGERLAGSAVHLMRAGWQYEHAPFSCQRLPRLTVLADWAVNAANPPAPGLLAQGWHALEAGGVWSSGSSSQLLLPLAGGAKNVRLRLEGYYHGKQTGSVVEINGKALGWIDLPLTWINLPAQDGPLKITLRHAEAESPFARGDSADTRVLGFHLTRIIVQRVEAPPP